MGTAFHGLEALKTDDFVYLHIEASDEAGHEGDIDLKLLTIENLVPGYVLVKMVMNDDTWYVVRNTRGCTGFVGPASKPVPLSPEEVEKMGVEKAAPLAVDFKVGDNVQITAGPLEGFMGLVEAIDTESFKVKLKVNMFGRETPAEVDIAQVELP